MFGIISDIVGSLAGNMFADERQDDSQNFNEDQAAQNRTFNAEEAFKQRMWNEHMRRTAHQDTVWDLKQAGLNPMLAFMKGPNQSGPGATASGTPATSGIASPTVGHSIQAGMQSASQIEVNRAVEDRTRAEADRARAERDEIIARTPTHAVNIKKTEQDIAESKQRIERILTEIPLMQQQQQHSAAQTAQAHQMIENLKEEIPKIRSSVQQLRAYTQLNVQQARESMARSDLNDAEHDEIRNRLKQNLPEVERLLKDLELKHLRLTTHGRGMDAAASANIIGAWRATIRALTGQQSILGR